MLFGNFEETHNRIHTFYQTVSAFSFILVTILNIIVLPFAWNMPCENEFKIWLLFHTIVMTTDIIITFVRAGKGIDYTALDNIKPLKYVTGFIILLYVVNFMWGWIWVSFLAHDTCSSYMSTALIFNNVINTIYLGIHLVLLFVFYVLRSCCLDRMHTISDKLPRLYGSDYGEL